MTDLERQGISGSQATEQYGAVGPSKKAQTGTADKLPLFLGHWDICPERLYRIALVVYVGWFTLHRCADLAYILTVDARFPAGLGHLYPSEAQRLESVSCTRQVLLCGMLHRTLVFCFVMTLVYFQLFARSDNWLRAGLSAIGSGFGSCCAPVGRCCSACWTPLGSCLSTCFCCGCAPRVWAGNIKDRVLGGKLTTDFLNRFGFRLSIRELLLGSLYLTLFAAAFFLLSAPFTYWMQMLDLKFGFANASVVSPALFKKSFVLGLLNILIWGVPQKFGFLVVLQYRLGWVFMWAGLIFGIFYAQHNVKMLAPMLGMDMKFPEGDFAVGRGFPWVPTSSSWAPWISLNRLYFADPYHNPPEPGMFFTDDKSRGNLALLHTPSGHWVIQGNPILDPMAAVYTQSAVAQLADGLTSQSWSGLPSNGPSGQDTRVGMRSGKELRDKLFGFARERKIGIGDIYMVDGSHRDARANAFVTGAGNYSIIGLYDTLFLGQRGSDADENAEKDDGLANGESLIQHASEVVQDVDIEKEEQDSRAPRNSAQTQAMTDDEIVSILVHELAHSDLRHMEQGMVQQIFTSFLTFATLGWMAASPIAAAALGLQAPLLHVGACAYEHLVGPPLDGFIKLFTDGLTRHNEYEADAYAAMISEKYAVALQTSLAKLSVNSNQDPDIPWFYEALHADHPTFSNRWAHIEEVRKKAYGHKKDR